MATASLQDDHSTIVTMPFDEIMGQPGGERRAELGALHRWLDGTPPLELGRRQLAAEATFRQLGITFAVYGHSEASERIIPFDIVPRVFLASEWALLSAGLVQRVEALNAFLQDIHGERRIFADGVLPADLIVDDDTVFMRTIAGPVRVDVICRRVDDDYLDPLVFRPDSMLGVPGLIAAYAAGNVAILNAPGNGIADDKAIYSYMPEIVRFYPGGEAMLPNVETWRCREPQALRYTLDHLDELVVKLVDGSGGYGMLVGPIATRAAIETFRAALVAEPHRYIAQPTLALSTVPTLADAGLSPRHVDFRPFVLTGAKGVEVVPGGLTRVALREGSLVVNSSQGGGTKDSFVLMDDAPHQTMGAGAMTQTMRGIEQRMGED